MSAASASEQIFRAVATCSGLFGKQKRIGLIPSTAWLARSCGSRLTALGPRADSSLRASSSAPEFIVAVILRLRDRRGRANPSDDKILRRGRIGPTHNETWACSPGFGERPPQ